MTQGLDAPASERTWLEHVRPEGWSAPTPEPKYDLVVIGGGTAGLVCAMGAAGLGARVALVERHRLGGDCLNTGCVPSKAVIRSARAIAELRKAESLGIRAGEAAVDFGTVMGRMRARRATLAVHDSAARLRAAGVHVFFGDGRFADPATIVVGSARLRFGRAVIATGTRPAVPPIPGLDRSPFLTNETIFDLTAQPRRLMILGGGPIGCELAQAFSRLGSIVTIFERADQLLPREAPEAASVIRRALAGDRVQIELGVTVEGVDASGGDVRVVARRAAAGTGPHTFTTAGDALLVATGRAPNVEGLDLEAAGVRLGPRGIAVNDRLQSSNRRVFASGDVCGMLQFTHAADAMSRLVVQNALFFGRRRASALVIPWVTYTDPEVAHVGVTHGDVARSAGRLSTITIDLDRVDRAVVDDETDGFVAVHHERGRLRGATIVAAHAGGMIAEAVYALTQGGTLASLSATVHPYPTAADALRKAGDEYRRQALTPRVRRLLTRYFDWTR